MCGPVDDVDLDRVADELDSDLQNLKLPDFSVGVYRRTDLPVAQQKPQLVYRHNPSGELYRYEELLTIKIKACLLCLWGNAFFTLLRVCCVPIRLSCLICMDVALILKGVATFVSCKKKAYAKGCKLITKGLWGIPNHIVRKIHEVFLLFTFVIPIQLASLQTVFFPLSGRRLVAKLEQLTYVCEKKDAMRVKYAAYMKGKQENFKNFMGYLGMLLFSDQLSTCYFSAYCFLPLNPNRWKECEKGSRNHQPVDVVGADRPHESLVDKS